MGNISFSKGEGGLARAAEGEDHISGLVFYGTKPTEFGTADVVQLQSLSEAEALGIVNTGTAQLKSWWYHVKRFFKQSDGATLYVGIFVAPVSGYDFSEILTIQRFADGKIKQLGIYITADFALTQVTAIQTKAVQMYQEHTPLVVLLAANITNAMLATIMTTGSTLNLALTSANYFSLVLGQDGNGEGAGLAVTLGKSLTCLGTALGVISKSAVHENMGWVEKFNVSDADDFELDVPAFANGVLVKSFSPDQIAKLDTHRYIYLKKYSGDAGTYFSDSYTAIGTTSDYAFIENNRTIDKGVRGIRKALLPKFNSPLRVNKDGKLSADVVKYLETVAQKPLGVMLSAGELSGYTVKIDPNNNVLSTSRVDFEVKMQPVGVARDFNVKIGFTIKL